MDDNRDIEHLLVWERTRNRQNLITEQRQGGPIKRAVLFYFLSFIIFGLMQIKVYMKLFYYLQKYE